MSLIRTDRNVPKDAIPVSMDEAMAYQWEMIYSWKPFSDVWAIRLSTYAVAFANSATGWYIHSYYRRKLKLGNYGFSMSFIPLMAMPGMFGSMFHRQLITTRILVMEEPCPPCTHMTAVAFQVACGVVYPLILGPLGMYMLASRYDVARIPILHTEKRKMWEFHMKTSRALYRTLGPYFVANVLMTSLLVHFQFKNFIDINEKMIKAEELYKKRVEMGHRDMLEAKNS